MKIRVGVFFGGKSVEHDISIISANQTIKALDTSLYEVIPVYITKDLQWYTGDVLLELSNYTDVNKMLANCTRVQLRNESDNFVLTGLKHTLFKKAFVKELDVAFPVMHGTNGEDGAIQGYFEMVGIPYVGCRVGSAAVGQDKVYMKNILRDSKLPITNFEAFFISDWGNNQNEIINRIKENVQFPAIVKPSRLGSSIGISKADTEEELIESINDAFNYDSKVVVEAFVNNLVEVNASVLGDYVTASCAALERVMGSGEILDFTDKYQSQSSTKSTKTEAHNNGMAAAKRVIPADISENLTDEIKRLALQTFKVLDASGVCRIDFMINTVTKEVFVNEINTIPGSLAFYLWQEVGVDFTMLTSKLIDNAIEFNRRNNAMTFSFSSSVLENLGKQGVKGAKTTKI